MNLSIFTFKHYKAYFSLPLKKILSHVSSLMGVVVLVIICNIFIKLINHEPDFRELAVGALSSKTQVLMIGNSRLTNGIDPEQIKIPTVSLSVAMMNYIIAEKLISRHLSSAPNIKLVILGFHPSSLIYLPEKGFPIDEMKAYDILDDHPKKGPLISFKSLREILANFYRWRITPRNLYFSKSIEHKPGFFPKRGKIEPQRDLAEMYRRMKQIAKNHKIQSLQKNREALIRILDFLKSRNIDIVLLQFPLHSIFIEKGLPSEWVEKFDQTKNIITKRYQSIEVWDYSRWAKMKEEYFDNYDHLNEQGAKIFSKEINERISKKLL